MSDVTESPVNPKSTLSYRLMLSVVIGLGVLIVGCIVLLVVGLSLGWGKQDEQTASQAAAAKKPVMMRLDSGYRILSNDTQPGRLILHVRSDTRDEIDIIDLNDGHLVAQIHAEPPK